MMSSALAMVLMAAMAIPGNGPEKVSGEVERTRRLDIDGKWEGIGWAAGEVWWAESNNRTLVMRCVFGEQVRPNLKTIGADCWDVGEIKERGGDKLSIRRNLFEGWYVGIYKWDGDRLIICFRRVEHSRPTSFQAGKQQWLLILHRVKPSK